VGSLISTYGGTAHRPATRTALAKAGVSCKNPREPSSDLQIAIALDDVANNGLLGSPIRVSLALINCLMEGSADTVSYSRRDLIVAIWKLLLEFLPLIPKPSLSK